MYALTASDDVVAVASTGMRDASRTGSSDAPKSAGRDVGGTVWQRGNERSGKGVDF
jgi:hypothetical protein